MGRCMLALSVSAKMIRSQDSIGLIASPVGSEAGYRSYGDSDVHTLTFIRRARDLGFPIKQIRELLALWRDRLFAGGVVAALAGPALARLGGDLLQPTHTASFLILSVVSLVAVGVLLGVKVSPSPRSRRNACPASTSWRDRPPVDLSCGPFRRRHRLWVVNPCHDCDAACHGARRPWARRHCSRYSIACAGTFLPSFVTGSLIAPFGVLQVMFSIALLLA